MNFKREYQMSEAPFFVKDLTDNKIFKIFRH